MEHCFLDDTPIAQMFNDDPLQQCGRDAGIPDPFGIHDDDRAAGADAEAGRFAALHAARAKEQTFPLEQCGEQPVEFPPALIRRAKTADAHQDVARVRVHPGRERCIGHGWTIS